jgi:O-acetyl-ADP-ribose deacetylase (regulator of RNase III)
MSVKTINGDLLELSREGHFDYILHGCNCFNTMGAGIALQIKNRYPEAYKADQKTILADTNKLGTFSYATIPSCDLIVVNLYTQFEPGRNFNLSALDLALLRFTNQLEGTFIEDTRIGLPYIGAGIGGGNWTQIRKVIKKHLDKYDTTIVKYVK